MVLWFVEYDAKLLAQWREARRGGGNARTSAHRQALLATAIASMEDAKSPREEGRGQRRTAEGAPQRAEALNGGFRCVMKLDDRMEERREIAVKKNSLTPRL